MSAANFSITSNTPIRPHSLEAEKALLGELLLNNESLDEVVDFLKSQHFILPIHKTIYDLIIKKVRLNQLATPITLREYLDREDKVGDISAYEYAMQLTTAAVTLSNAASFGNMIYDMYRRRELIDIGTEITTKAYDASIDITPDDQIQKAEEALYNLAEKGQAKSGFVSFKNSLREAINIATTARKKKTDISGYETHLPSLDNRLCGLHPSDLIIIAGRPGMGKTALATNIAFNIAKSFKIEDESNKNTDHQPRRHVVGFFSLEMAAEQLAMRIISEQAAISSYKIRNSRSLSEEDFLRVAEKAVELENINLYIDDTGGASIAQIASRARRLKRQYGLDLLVIDYIQLIQATKNTGNRVSEITEITVALKSLAKELNVPVIALSQLSRLVEHRENRRPQLSDLRESGSIEQDADIVLFVYRDAYYKKFEEPALDDIEAHQQWQDEYAAIRTNAEIIIAKNRHGETGKIDILFEPDYTKFYCLADESHLPERIG